MILIGQRQHPSSQIQFFHRQIEEMVARGGGGSNLQIGDSWHRMKSTDSRRGGGGGGVKSTDWRFMAQDDIYRFKKRGWGSNLQIGDSWHRKKSTDSRREGGSNLQI